MAGFFAATVVDRREPVPSSPRCGACGLDRGCRSPRMPVTGEGRRGVLVVAEAPGEDEDRRNTQLVGKSGQELRRHLATLGWDLDRDCWKTNALSCHPPENEKPTDGQVEACRPRVYCALRELKPRVVLLLGGTAVKSVVGPLWRADGRDPGDIGRWAGWRVPCRQTGSWLCPTWHPSYLLRQKDRALETLFRGHLEAALGLDEHPWPGGPPDPAERVECVLEPSRASAVLRRMREKGGRIAFDYETDRLKPDHPDARIVCCSVCWEGRKTIAYPWHGEAIEATRELLLDPKIGKLGWNIKFEERWTRRQFGRGVEGWLWDGMLAAHVLDNRPGITGAKFQAFVRLGLADYGGAVKPLMEASGGNARNRVAEADLGELLRYCGMDSLVEYEMGVRQMAELGFSGQEPSDERV